MPPPFPGLPRGGYFCCRPQFPSLQPGGRNAIQQSSLLHLSLWEPQPSFSLSKAPSSSFPSSLQKMSSECSCVQLSSPSWHLPVSFSDEVERFPRSPQLLSACSGVTVAPVLSSAACGSLCFLSCILCVPVWLTALCC